MPRLILTRTAGSTARSTCKTSPLTGTGSESSVTSRRAHARSDALIEQAAQRGSGNRGLASPSSGPPPWVGLRPFRVADKVRESASMVSFLTGPEGGQRLAVREGVASSYLDDNVGLGEVIDIGAPRFVHARSDRRQPADRAAERRRRGDPGAGDARKPLTEIKRGLAASRGRRVPSAPRVVASGLCRRPADRNLRPARQARRGARALRCCPSVRRPPPRPARTRRGQERPRGRSGSATRPAGGGDHQPRRRLRRLSGG